MADRDANGRFLQGGASPNPGGRPAEAFHLAEEARKYGPECIAFLVRVLRGREHTLRAARWRMKAAIELLNRGYGPPAQTVSLESADDVVRFTLHIGPPDKPLLLPNGRDRNGASPDVDG